MNPNVMQLPLRRTLSFPNLGASEAAHDVPMQVHPGDPVVTVDDLHQYEHVTDYREIVDGIVYDLDYAGDISDLYGQLRLVMRYGSVANYVNAHISRDDFPLDEIHLITNEVMPDVETYVTQTPTMRVISTLYDKVGLHLRRLIARPLLRDPVTYMNHPVACEFMEKVVRTVPARDLRAVSHLVDQRCGELMYPGHPFECLKQVVRVVRARDMPRLMHYLVGELRYTVHEAYPSEILQMFILKGQDAYDEITAIVDAFTNTEGLDGNYTGFLGELVNSYSGNRTIHQILDNANLHDRERVSRALVSVFPRLLTAYHGYSLVEKVVQFCNPADQFRVAAHLAPIDCGENFEDAPLYHLAKSELGRDIINHVLRRFIFEPRMHVMFHLNIWRAAFLALPRGEAFLDILCHSGRLRPTPLVWRVLAPGYQALGLPFEANVENPDDYLIDVGRVDRNVRMTTRTEETDVPIIPVQVEDDNTNFPAVRQRGERLIVNDPVLRFFNGTGVNPENNDFEFRHIEGRVMAFACDPHGSQMLYHRLTNEYQHFTDDEQMRMMRELAPFAQAASVAPHVGRIIRQLLVNGQTEMRDLFLQSLGGAEVDIMIHPQGCELALVAITRADDLGRAFKERMLQVLEELPFPLLPLNFRAFVHVALRVVEPIAVAEQAIASIRRGGPIYDLADVEFGPETLTSILARPPSPQRYAVMRDLVVSDTEVIDCFHDPNRAIMLRSLIGATAGESVAMFEDIKWIVADYIETIFKAPHSWLPLRVLFECDTERNNKKLVRYILTQLPSSEGEVVVRRYTHGDAKLTNGIGVRQPLTIG